jgi:hypothetical protein
MPITTGAGWIVLDTLDLKRKLQQFEDGAIKNEKQFLSSGFGPA